MNLVILVNGPRGVYIAKRLVKIKYLNIKGILYSDKRKKKFLENSLKKLKKKFIYQKKINSKISEKLLKSLNLDLILIAGYSQILKKNILKQAKKFVINLHGGPVKKYRGGSPLNWQIINGEKKIGLSLIKTDTGIDTGGVISQKYFKLNYNDKIKDVHGKANKFFLKMLLPVLKKIKANKKIKVNYQKTKGKYHFQRSDKDGEINFSKITSKNAYNFVRAISHPYPGAWSKISINNKNKKIRVFDCEIKKDLKNKINKNFLKFKNKLYAKTLDYPILIKKHIFIG